MCSGWNTITPASRMTFSPIAAKSARSNDPSPWLRYSDSFLGNLGHEAESHFNHLLLLLESYRLVERKRQRPRGYRIRHRKLAFTVVVPTSIVPGQRHVNSSDLELDSLLPSRAYNIGASLSNLRQQQRHVRLIHMLYFRCNNWRRESGAR